MTLKKWMLRSGVIAAVVVAAPCTTAMMVSAEEVTETETETADMAEWTNKLIVDVKAGSKLNVREDASTSADIIDTLTRGEELEFIQIGTEWTKVITEEGAEGYVSNEYVLFGAEAAEFAEELEAASDITCEYLYSPSSFKSKGVLRYNGYRWTYYSQRVLPGGGLKIPGRHVDENGYVCDGDGYICLAARGISKGTVIATPLGKMGKVYDVCGKSGTLDVYVAW